MNNASSSATASSQLDAYLESLGVNYAELLYYTEHHQMGNIVCVQFLRSVAH